VKKEEDIKAILDKKTLSDNDIQVLIDYQSNDSKNLLYSFFTPKWLCQEMYNLAIRYGFDPKKGKVLEPACGTGNFLEILETPSLCTAFELDKINYLIAQKRVSEVKIYNTYFEKSFLQPPKYRSLFNKGLTWLEDYPFDLVIGNPPYGSYSGLYKTHFNNLKAKQFEIFFTLKSLDMLRKGGLLVFIIPSGFLRNSYASQKEKIASKADIVDAYRMPDIIFKGTKIPTDIIVLRKK
jgi:type I restriction-modification system DNA methylase subunit